MPRGAPAFLLGVLAGCAGGFVALLVLDDGRDGAPDPSAGPAALATELQHLRVELRELRRMAEASPPAAVVPDAPASPLVDPRLDEVAARLEALESALRELTPRLEAAAAAVQSVEGVVQVQSVADRMPKALPDRPADVGRLDALRGRKMDQLTDLHALWTYEQVGQEYGRPTHVRPSPGGRGIKYFYVLPDGEELCFWFIDAKVVGAFW